MNGLSKYYIKRIIGCFATELTATATSQKLRINRNTVNKYYRIIREALADYQQLYLSRVMFEKHAPNGCYFSWHRNIGLSMEFNGDSPVYQVVEAGGNIYIRKVRKGEVTQKELESQFNFLDAQYYIFPPINGYSGSGDAEQQLNDTASEMVKDFLYYAKEKLAKFYGVKSDYIDLYLRELEFRFNNRNKDAAKIIMRILPHHSRKMIK